MVVVGLVGLAGAAPAAAATPSARTYRVSLVGAESLAWQIHQPPDCPALAQGADGSGAQTVALATVRPAVVRVVASPRSRRSVAVTVQRPLRVRESWNRAGSLIDHVCSRGDESAGVTGCGVRMVSDEFTLAGGDGATLALRAGRVTDPYGGPPSTCPFAGFEPFLAGLRAHFDVAAARAHRRFVVRFRVTDGPRNLLWENPSGDDQDVSGSVTDDLTATFTPVRR